jgi:hypothetical protein
MNSNTIAEAKLDLDFFSIDGPNTGLPSFVISMLRIGQIVTANTLEKREITAASISRWMLKHRDKIPCTYTPLQIREKLWQFDGEIRGGGVKIEWGELSGYPCRNVPHYDFTFSRIIPEAAYGPN